MLKRLVLTLIISGWIVPTAALADDATMPSPTPTPQSSAAALGPQIDSTGAASTGDAALLQPAGQEIQNAPAPADSQTTPTSNQLQAPATSDQLKVMLGGEADGAPQTLGDNSALNPLTELILGGAFLLLLAGFVLHHLQLAAAKRRYSSR